MTQKIRKIFSIAFGIFVVWMVLNNLNDVGRILESASSTFWPLIIQNVEKGMKFISGMLNTISAN